MKIYLAARYSRRLELCGYRDQLHLLGHQVTSRWLNGGHQIDAWGIPIGDHGECLIEDGDERAAAKLRARFADEDILDLAVADCLISFTEEPRKPSTMRGARHVEFGAFIGFRSHMRPFRCIVVGHRENVFHWLPYVEFFPSWQKCFSALSQDR